MNRQNFYAGGGLDRAAHRRADREWLARQLSDPKSRLVPVWRNHNLIHPGEVPNAALLPGDAVAAAVAEAGHWALLGLQGETAYFAVDLSHIADPLPDLSLAGIGEFVDLRQVGPVLSRDQGSLLAYARGLMYWHNRHRFCGVCGSPTAPAEAGFMRQCLNGECGAPHFPRTDPAVIMLVTDRDRCLLGRAARFPTGMHSTLAGFVEPGESLEEAVAREVFEEVGVRVAEVRYHSSQPWPFPSSIMLGFHATAATTALTVDPVELESAAWYTREALLAVSAAPPDAEGLRLPRPDSIARRLIEDWLHDRA